MSWSWGSVLARNLRGKTASPIWTFWRLLCKSFVTNKDQDAPTLRFSRVKTLHDFWESPRFEESGDNIFAKFKNIPIK